MPVDTVQHYNKHFAASVLPGMTVSPRTHANACLHHCTVPLQFLCSSKTLCDQTAQLHGKALTSVVFQMLDQALGGAHAAIVLPDVTVFELAAAPPASS